MKTGRNLQELAVELERQDQSKKDYIADTRKLRLEVAADDKIVLQGVDGGMPLRSTAHSQLANVLGIPKAYYDRMHTEAPDLLAANANRWLERQEARKMIRTLDGQVRAVLSDSYRPLDNVELATAVLPKLIALKATVVSGEVTESRFYLKAVTDRVSGEVALNDRIQAGVVVSNSEIGQGSLRVEALDYRLVCLNGMIREASVRKAHLGRGTRYDVLEDAREFYRDETRQLEDRAFFAKVQDATAAMFDPDRFMKRIEQYKQAGERKITADPVAVVEVTAKRFGLAETEKSSILTHLIQGGDLSNWGLANAVTRAAQDVESYDLSTRMEALGGEIIELPQADWRTIAVKPVVDLAV